MFGFMQTVQQLNQLMSDSTDMNRSNRTERNIPYTQDEKTLLMAILADYESVINDMKADATSVRKKRIAWTKIALEYNANSFVTKRTVMQLKRCWEKIKAKAKKDRADERRRARIVAGGTNMVDQTVEDEPSTVSQERITIAEVQKTKEFANVTVRLRKPATSPDAATTKTVAIQEVIQAQVGNLRAERCQKRQIHKLMVQKMRMEIQQSIALHELEIQQRTEMHEIAVRNASRL